MAFAASLIMQPSNGASRRPTVNRNSCRVTHSCVCGLAAIRLTSSIAFATGLSPPAAPTSAPEVSTGKPFSSVRKAPIAS